MELLLENYYRQAEDLANEARELRLLIDDSESIIFINLDRLATLSSGLPTAGQNLMLPSLSQIHLQGQLRNSVFMGVRMHLQSQHKKLHDTFLASELDKAKQQDTLTRMYEKLPS